jgi:hypothetical protein
MAVIYIECPGQGKYKRGRKNWDFKPVSQHFVYDYFLSLATSPLTTVMIVVA